MSKYSSIEEVLEGGKHDVLDADRDLAVLPRNTCQIRVEQQQIAKQLPIPADLTIATGHGTQRQFKDLLEGAALFVVSHVEQYTLAE